MGKKQTIEIGRKFNRLTVIKQVESYRAPANGAPKRTVLCKCECGKEVTSVYTQIKLGKIKSCGCYGREMAIKSRTSHGMSTTHPYQIWKGMKQRCFNKNNKSYYNYGGRGITLSKEWLDFKVFYMDIGFKYKKGLSIERIDNNGNYCKENCKFIPLAKQSSNRRDTRIIKYKGLTKTASEWDKHFGFYQDCISRRMRLGLTFNQAIKMKRYEQIKK